MCAYRDCFDKYEEKNNGQVVMGNDTVCNIEGIGTVKIKMHDGIVRTLGDVRFIPDLRKNLISLGILERNGYSYSAFGGKLKVTRGSLVVMRADRMPNNLYKLSGVTVTGATAISAQDDSEDMT
jgi:hypothetical protein